jgi:hypothetical protein
MISLDRSGYRPASRREESSRFLKKAAMLGHGRCRRQRPWPSLNKVFLLLFVHKKKSFPLACADEIGRAGFAAAGPAPT